MAIIGAGSVGLSLGLLLKRAGHRIVGCTARSPGSLERAASILDCPSATRLSEATGKAEVVVVAVPDDAVPGVAQELASEVKPSAFVFHTAGALGVEALREVSEGGAHALAIHPLQSIPDHETGLRRLPGSFFGITCAAELEDWARALVEQIGGKALFISESDRPAYHAAAAIASNFLVTLASLVEETGMPLEPYLPLMSGTLANLEALGAAKALTGPVVRGDASTVRRHLRVLSERSPDGVEAYRALARATLRAAAVSKRISAPDAAVIEELLGTER